MTDIAVVVPCYNLGRFVGEAVESVMRQRRPATELVVVDDGSTDLYTRRQLASMRYPSTTVVRTANRGLAAARNHGIRLTSAPYLVTLDADDRLHPEYLARTAERLDRDPGIGFVSTAIRGFGDASYTWTPPPCTTLNALIRGTPHPASLFRRDVWRAVGGFDESPALLKGCEDLDFWLSALERGFRGEVIDEPLLEYRVRAASMHQSSVASRGQLGQMTTVFRKHHATIASLGPALLIEKDQFIEGQRQYEAALRERRSALERERLAVEADIARMARELAHAGRPLIDWADLARAEPFTPVAARDRGEPIDEFYARSFLSTHDGPECRDVLEVHLPWETPVEHAPRRAASLAGLAALADQSFDCIVAGQVLRAAHDVPASVRELYRVLRPGGHLLCTLPALRAMTGTSLDEVDCWRFTEAAARRLFADVFSPEAVTVTGYGNVMTCAAFLAGLAADEVTPAERDAVDPMFPLLYGVRAVRI